MAERWVLQSELSDITGFHVKSLQMMYRREPGVLVTRPSESGSPNKLEYKLPDTVVNLLKRERAAGNRGRLKSDLKGAEKWLDRKGEADAKMAELKLAEMQGDLIRLDLHEKRLDDICGRLSSALEVIPSKYLSRIQVARTELEAQEVGEKIRDDTKEVMFGLADELEEEGKPDEMAEDEE